MKTAEEINNIFSYHPPKKGQCEIYEAIREKAKEFAVFINQVCPDSREKSISFTSLENSVFWANASIARNGHAVAYETH